MPQLGSTAGQCGRDRINFGRPTHGDQCDSSWPRTTPCGAVAVLPSHPSSSKHVLDLARFLEELAPRTHPVEQIGFFLNQLSLGGHALYRRHVAYECRPLTWRGLDSRGAASVSRPPTRERGHAFTVALSRRFKRGPDGARRRILRRRHEHETQRGCTNVVAGVLAPRPLSSSGLALGLAWHELELTSCLHVRRGLHGGGSASLVLGGSGGAGIGRSPGLA